jgi:hypothetical protein
MEKSVGCGAFTLLNKFASIPFRQLSRLHGTIATFAAVHGQGPQIESSQPIQFKPRAIVS